jgi:hypothetical protein
MDKEILVELKRLRQDLEVGAAINIIEGINTIETLGVFGHWIRTKRAPMAAETKKLQVLARQHWAAQVRHALRLLKADGTDLDEKMADLADLLAATAKKSSKGRRGKKKR